MIVFLILESGICCLRGSFSDEFLSSISTAESGMEMLSMGEPLPDLSGIEASRDVWIGIGIDISNEYRCKR